MLVLLWTKTVPMAREGISAMRMRRKALAREASILMRQKAASRGWFLWNWTLKFWKSAI